MRIFFLLALLSLSGLSSARLPPAPIAVSIKQVPLDPAHPERTVVGRLRYWGGIEITSDDPRIGGFSSLKWAGKYGEFYAVTDVGNFASLAAMERKQRLLRVDVVSMGRLHGPDGAELRGTEVGDAESLARDGRRWLVSFEHDHKILSYKSLWEPAAPSGLDPRALFPDLEKNHGVETLAARDGRIFLCAERHSDARGPNCFIKRRGRMEPVSLPPMPEGLDQKTAFPVDADWGRDGTLYILMRSWSGGNDNRAAIVARSPGGKLRTLATLLPPLTTDNYEGLAVREKRGRTFMYILSDDNFHEYDEPGKPEAWQRTLFMKFELIG
jgi:hypothetical protein